MSNHPEVFGGAPARASHRASRGAPIRASLGALGVALLCLLAAFVFACAPRGNTPANATRGEVGTPQRSSGRVRGSDPANDAPSAGAPAARNARAPRGDRSPRPGVGFRTHELLVEHYEKHGREFGGLSMDQYLRRAQVLRDRDAGGAVLEIVRDDGVITRFDRLSGDFIAFNRSGVIRTFFRPGDGERYFRRQALRQRG